MQLGDVVATAADTTALENGCLLPSIALSEGIEKFADWYAFSQYDFLDGLIFAFSILAGVIISIVEVISCFPILSQLMLHSRLAYIRRQSLLHKYDQLGFSLPNMKYLLW